MYSVQEGQELIVMGPAEDNSSNNTNSAQFGDTLSRIATKFNVTTAQLRQRNNLEDINTRLTPQSLRHTHTSLLAQAGVSLPEIMERFGHKMKIQQGTFMYTLRKT